MFEKKGRIKENVWEKRQNKGNLRKRQNKGKCLRKKTKKKEFVWEKRQFKRKCLIKKAKWIKMFKIKSE